MSDKSKNETVSTSWFAVFNNPSEHGYTGTPEEICERLKQEWIGDSTTKTGAWAHCTSEKGLEHIHMVLCDSKPMRFSAVKKSYCQGMHFEETKGTKKQADDYINKRGAFEEKGEVVNYITYHGEITGRQGKRSDLELYYERLENGETPKDIMRSTPKAYVHQNVLKRMYYDIRCENTPIVRDMRVYWHTGPTGSGKSYERVKLAKEVGEDNIYYLSAFNSGAFDEYNGQPILWIEDYRSEFKLQELLRYLDCYKADVPSRYANVKALWNEVHITSVLTPSECYSKVTLEENDRVEQLLRRITSLVYHFKDNNGDYCQLYFNPYEKLNDVLLKVDEYKSFMSEWTLLISESDYEGDKL